MGDLLSYSLQAAVIMTLLYLGYKWLMASTTFHATNRLTLLLIIAISWAMPALTPLFAPRPAVDIEIGIPITIVDAADAAAPVAAPEPFHWESLAVTIYIIGMAIATLFTLFSAAKVWRIIRRGARTDLGRYTLVVSDKVPGPFSWGRYIVIRQQDCDRYQDMVVAHETAHLDRLHWVDLLIAHLNIILQWYSPASYLILHEMKCVHEYQADSSAAGDDPYEYQIMLLKKTVGSSFPTFADSLNHSQIKQRLTMMMQNETKAWRRLAALAIPAMTAAALTVLSTPSVASVIESIRESYVREDSADKVTKSSFNGQISQVLRIADDSPSSSAEETETDPETITADDSADPEKKSEEVKEVEMDEITVISFRNSGDDKKGSNEPPAYFVDGKLCTGSINDLNPSQIKAMSIVKNDPNYPQGKVMIEMYRPGEEKLHVAAQKIAEFKGGEAEMIDFLKRNIRYPEGVKINKTTRVIVQFTVGADGSVTDPKIIRSAPEELLNAEALRVLSLMSGKWEPATDNGKPIATRFTLPINCSPGNPDK